MTTWTLPNGDIVRHGDEIEMIGSNKRFWRDTIRSRKIFAYVSNRYPYTGATISFQIEGYGYSFDDVHSTSIRDVRLVRPAFLQYDPNQQGETDEDI